MQRFEKGQGRAREIDMLQELTKQVEGHTICGELKPFSHLELIYVNLVTDMKNYSSGRSFRMASTGSRPPFPPSAGRADKGVR